MPQLRRRPPQIIRMTLAFCLGAIGWVARGVGTQSDYPELTNVIQLRSIQAEDRFNYRIDLAADVWWAEPATHRLVVHDATGGEEVEIDLQDRGVEAGERIRISGNGTVIKTANGHRLGIIGPVADDDGVHAMTEKSGQIYLSAGRQPFRVDWFNGIDDFGLKVEYEGPDLPRQKIPATALFHQEGSNWVAGLNYSAYAVAGESLPDFKQLTAIRSGTVTGFDLSVMPQREHVGLEFTGFLDVPREGAYTFYLTSDDGSQLFAGSPALQIKVTGHCEFPKPRPLPLGQLLAASDDFQWVQAEGTVTSASERDNGMELEFDSGSGHIRLELADAAGLKAGQIQGRRIRATGVCQGGRTTDGLSVAGTLLVAKASDLEWIDSISTETQTNAAQLPTLTEASEIHRLKREEAQRGYPVDIRGVVTSVLPEHQAFTLQDTTRGIYVQDLSASRSFQPQVGEFLEVSGITDPSLFAPIVNARAFRSLGAGVFPEPVRPTWDQLRNGSMDAQYVELQGIITSVGETNITLLTHDGRIDLELRMQGLKGESLTNFEDALIRIRGCLFAHWNYVTHQIQAGDIRINGATISVDQPAPGDVFAIPARSVADLLLFDPQASVFERVKVAGQVLYVNGDEGYLSDGQNALRFIAKRPVNLRTGDLAEVVGFPDVSGASPVLREAVLRRTGESAMPEARELSETNLARVDYDANLVCVKGVLASIRRTPTEWILEIQSGVRTFAARLNAENGSADSLPVGGRLKLTGVYSSLGANRATGQNITAFELLLNSPADIQILARPPWWTLQRMLIMVGALVCGLAVTVLWITQLHRKVEERTGELEVQIRERQLVEQQRAMEQERARVAQDLHDELGSSLTEISMLGVRARATGATDQKRRDYLEQMSMRARDMVAALDEIVWAMNPRHDSLGSLVSYFCLYADRFLGLANITWKLEGEPVPDNFALDSRHRHQLFLAFKEALTNVVRHSGATEVRLGIGLDGREVRLALVDNGHGLPTGMRTEDMDGVANMRTRLEKLGGRFDITSTPTGTTVRFHVPAR